LFDIKKDLL